MKIIDIMNDEEVRVFNLLVKDESCLMSRLAGLFSLTDNIEYLNSDGLIRLLPKVYDMLYELSAYDNHWEIDSARIWIKDNPDASQEDKDKLGKGRYERAIIKRGLYIKLYCHMMRLFEKFIDCSTRKFDEALSESEKEHNEACYKYNECIDK